MNDTREDFRDALRRRLDAIAEAGGERRFWLRDDDAIAATDALRRLFAAGTTHDVPLCLAVIPGRAEESLRDEVAAAQGVWISQHGWRHDNHQPAGEKAAELGTARPAEAVLAELAEGRVRLEALFGERFRPVLTPPWNRLAPEVAARRGAVGLPFLSTFADMNADDPMCRNTHLDPIAWKRGRGFEGWQRMLMLVDEQLARDDGRPVGLLTHHLVHDEDVWAFVESFVETTSTHPAVRWVGPEELFPSL